MPVDDDTWMEFVRPGSTLCGLCGNTGVIDTRGRVESRASVECGVRGWCICPNGRQLKELGADLERWPSGNVPPDENAWRDRSHG